MLQKKLIPFPNPLFLRPFPNPFFHPSLLLPLLLTYYYYYPPLKPRLFQFIEALFSSPILNSRRQNKPTHPLLPRKASPALLPQKPLFSATLPYSPFYSPLIIIQPILFLVFMIPFLLYLLLPSSNLSLPLLPFQHPHPDAVVHHFHSRLNHSLHRREMASQSCFTGNPIDDCWRCDHNWETDRQRLADCGLGFGRYAMGGKGGAFYTVTDSSDDNPVYPKPGTIRHAVIQTEPLWIVFSQPMLIHLKVELIFNSFKTIDGRGSEVHFVGGGCITLQDITNVIIHGVYIHNCIPNGNTNVRDSPTHYGRRGISDGDGISISAARGIWVDHCDLSRCRDGLIDAVLGSTGITISNTRFSEHNEVMLLGHRDDYQADSGMQVTIAFNVFGEGLVQRMPRCRRGYIHVVNNDFTGWEMYAIGGSGGPTINSQGNRYAAPGDASAKEVTKRVETEERVWAGWNWRSEGDLLLNGAFFVPSGMGVDSQYVKASSLDAMPNSFVPHLTLNAGVLPSTPPSNRGGGGGGWVTLSPPPFKGGGSTDGGLGGGGGDGGDFYGMIFRGGAATARRRGRDAIAEVVVVVSCQLLIGWIY